MFCFQQGVKLIKECENKYKNISVARFDINCSGRVEYVNSEVHCKWDMACIFE